jgi:hypothetical protein
LEENCTFDAQTPMEVKNTHIRHLLVLIFGLFSKEKVQSFYEELGHDLRERRRYLDSAVIFGELVNKPDERFLSLCKAKAWDEALRVQCMFDVPGSGTGIEII